jgi:diguanylate cyclase (GGDEF)-like protein
MTWLYRLLPALAGAGRRTRAVGCLAFCVMIAGLGLHVASTVSGVSAAPAAFAAPALCYLGVIVLLGLRAATATEGRRGWQALAAAVGLWIAGTATATFVGRPAGGTVVGPADPVWLSFYPLALLGVVLRTRATLQRVVRSVRFDGVIGALSVAAIGWLFVIDPIIADEHARHAATVVNSSYVIGDLVLTAMTVAVLGLHGWRVGREWLLLAVGLAVFAAGDSLYLLQITHSTYAQGTAMDVLWGAGLTLIALSSWQTAPGVRHVHPTVAVLAPPFGFAVAALGVLVYAGLSSQAPVAAVVLAAGAALASMARTALTFREIRGLAEVRRLADTDDLTALPNRRHLERRLREDLDCARAQGTSVALLLIDLDRFKELNDTLGHRAGDLVLEQIGPRLRAVLRSGDVLARLGGDEFAAVLADAGDAEPVGRRIARALEEGLTVDGINVRIGASIGIAVFPEHADDAETLMQRADVAMYQAKAARSGHAFYERERDRHSRERLELIGELREAIGTDQLVLHFQPKLDLATGRVDDVEALVRWMHPERGLLGPGAFVPLAEQTGVMRELTEHVLDAALRRIAAWYAEGLDLSVAVNVSAATLLDEGWATDVGTALVAHGVPASRLRVEITEDALMADPERALRVVEGLVATGIGVSVDDFGTGYSSLGLLKHLPVDELKIDRTFVRDMLTDHADAAIVQSVVDLGSRLGLRTVAEGIEDEDTLARLAEYGVTLGQGFHIARPLPPAELERFIAGRAVTTQV